MPTKKYPAVIAIDAIATIEAAGEVDGKPHPPKFTSEFYTGGALEIDGWDLPVVVDLAGLENGKTLVANLDHERTQRVGNFQVLNDGQSLVAHGTAIPEAFPAAKQVVDAGTRGYQWQSSLEVRPREVEEVKAGRKVEVNGQSFEGPLYVTRKGTLKGFAFVSHGADDNTTATIAAIAASPKEKNMDPKFTAWIEAMGLDTKEMSADQLANLEADFSGREGARKTIAASAGKDGLASKQAEATRRKTIMQMAETACDEAMELERYEDISNIREARDAAIKAGTSVGDFSYQLQIATLTATPPHIATGRGNSALNDKVLEAAVCQAGNLPDIEKKFDDQTLQVAHDLFKSRIELRQMLISAAEANGYRSNHSSEVNLDVQRAAFGMVDPRRMQRASGFSTIDIANVVSNSANKFLNVGFMSVDQTCLRISARRSLKDFKAATTVSLTGDLQYDEVGPAGEIPHGTIADLTYTDQVKTYGRMLAITRQDIINDDLSALTSVPTRLGRGAMLKLNDIFWTVFLGGEAAGFWAAGNNNLNTLAADMTLAGLTQTEIIFMSQTDYDGKPLGVEPAILLVPTKQKAAANALTDPQSQLITGASSTLSDVNVFRGRFRVESSPYMHNTSYTGYSDQEWYMMADPNVMPTITIAALNGRIEPTVETADADFNVLGIQMRGYSDVGVALTEKKASVLADGNAS